MRWRASNRIEFDATGATPRANGLSLHPKKRLEFKFRVTASPVARLDACVAIGKRRAVMKNE